VASDAFGELGETIGSAFLPLVKAILPPLIKIIGLMGTLIEAVLPPITVLFTVLGTVLGAVLDAVIPLVTWVGQLIGQLVTKMQPILKTLQGLFGGVGDAIAGVVGWIQKLLDWIGKVLDAAGKLLDSLNPLKGFSLPSLPFGLAAPAPAGVGVSSRSSRGAVGGTVNVNIYGGDPRHVEAAVRRSLRRWRFTDGSTAAERDW
jgi:hypothetical protein